MGVRLIALEQMDLEQLRDWRNDDRLRHNFREYRLLNMNNQCDWFNHISISREVEMFGIATMGRVLVGVCGLCNINWVNRTAEVSIYVAPECQGQEIAIQALGALQQKAFEEFNLHRLWAEIYESNATNIALFQKCGYIMEGRMRQHIFKQGVYCDSFLYGLLGEK